MEQDRAGPGAGALGEQESRGEGPGGPEGRAPCSLLPALVLVFSGPAATLLPAYGIFLRPESASPDSSSLAWVYKDLTPALQALHTQVQLTPITSPFFLSLHTPKHITEKCPSVYSRLVPLPSELLLNPPQPSPNVPTSVKSSPVSSSKGRMNSCPSTLLPRALHTSPLRH